jgi:hypothetical protein
MKQITQSRFFAVLGLMALSGSVFAAGAGSISILSPKDGTTISGGAVIKLDYNLHPSSDGNHLHIYVDDQKPMVNRNVSGCPCSVDLPTLSPGKHMVVIKEARSDHSLTGVEKGVTFQVK